MYLVPSMCQAFFFLPRPYKKCPLAFLCSFWCYCALLECTPLGLKLAVFFNANSSHKMALEAEL